MNVAVGVNEAGQERFTFAIDYLSAAVSEFFYFVAFSNSQDVPISYGNQPAVSRPSAMEWDDVCVT